MLSFSGFYAPDAVLRASEDQPEVVEYIRNRLSEDLNRTPREEHANSHICFLLNNTDREILCEKNRISDSVWNRYIKGKECCRKSFLRGAFLVCGHLNSPEKGSHLEFSFRQEEASGRMVELLASLDISAKTAQRKDFPIVYIKSGEIIRDFLAKTGSTTQFFDFTNISIVKSLRNSVNRQVNCENANIDKTVSAATKHRKAIQKVLKSGYELPASCREIVTLRLENPEASLDQLGKLCSPPLSKAGVSHRLKKICLIADSLKDEA